MLVYIVGHQPVGGRKGSLQYDWFPGSQRDEAVERLQELVVHGDSRYSITFLPMDVPKTTDVEIKEWIEAKVTITVEKRR